MQGLIYSYIQIHFINFLNILSLILNFEAFREFPNWVVFSEDDCTWFEMLVKLLLEQTRPWSLLFILFFFWPGQCVICIDPDLSGGGAAGSTQFLSSHSPELT